MAIRQLTVDLDSAAPVYQQLKDQIRRKVQLGYTKPGVRLPTVRELALDFEINANVIRRICRELESEGYLIAKDGMGTFGIGLVEEAAQRRKKAFDV